MLSPVPTISGVVVCAIQQKAALKAEDPKCLLECLATIFYMEDTSFMEKMQVNSRNVIQSS